MAKSTRRAHARDLSILDAPQVVVCGEITEDLYADFRAQTAKAARDDLVVVVMTTLGGDPEVARAMAEEVRAHARFNARQRWIFLGRAVVYSAGVTFMSAFARSDRYLSRDCRLMIHERQIHKTLEIHGPLSACMASAQALVHEIENGMAIQDAGFADLVKDASLPLETLRLRARDNWYLDAAEALSLGLVEGLV